LAERQRQAQHAAGRNVGRRRSIIRSTLRRSAGGAASGAAGAAAGAAGRRSGRSRRSRRSMEHMEQARSSRRAAAAGGAGAAGAAGTAGAVLQTDYALHTHLTRVRVLTSNISLSPF
jgi:hypothetical protein